MAKVICTLPNASDSINGVKFHPLPDGAGRISDEIPDDVAAGFTEIAGYTLDGAPTDPAAASASDEKADAGATAAVVPPAAAKPAAAPAKPATASTKRGSKPAAAPVAAAPAVEPAAPAAADAPAGAGAEDDETIF